jgi:hypothetical protein
MRLAFSARTGSPGDEGVDGLPHGVDLRLDDAHERLDGGADRTRFSLLSAAALALSQVGQLIEAADHGGERLGWDAAGAPAARRR